MYELYFFDQIAERMLKPTRARTPNSHVRFIAQHLRLVWNARGAADIRAIEDIGQHDTMTTLREVTALKALDR
jgi:hypothetical protein